MKKITYLFVLVMTMFFVTSAQAQTPWKIINMEEATRWGGNASFDDGLLPFRSQVAATDGLMCLV